MVSIAAHCQSKNAAIRCDIRHAAWSTREATDPATFEQGQPIELARQSRLFRRFLSRTFLPPGQFSSPRYFASPEYLAQTA